MNFTETDRDRISKDLTDLGVGSAEDRERFIAAVEPDLCRYGDEFQQALNWPTPGQDRKVLEKAAKHFQRFSESLSKLGWEGNEAFVQALLSSACEPHQYNDGQQDTQGVHAIANRINWQRGDLGPAMEMIQHSLAQAGDECSGQGRGQSAKDRAKDVFGDHIVDVVCRAYGDELGCRPVTTTSDERTTFVSLLENIFRITTGGSTIEGKRHVRTWLDANPR